MDIQLFATDEELQAFPENKTDSSTVQDKTLNTKSINLAVSDLPRSHSDLPKISSKLPERKFKRKSRRDHRRKSRSRSNTRSKNPIGDRQATLAKNPTVYRQVDTAKYSTVDWQLVQARKPIVDRQSAQTNDQLEIKQEIQWISKPIHAAYLDQLVDRSVGPPPSEARLPGQPTLGSPETAPPVARQPVLRQPVLHPPMVCQPDCPFHRCCPFAYGPTWTRSLKPSHPRHFGTSTSVSRLAKIY